MNDTPELLAITGATVIDGNGGAPIDNAVLLIEGTRIVTVGDRSTQVPPRARQIEARGKFVIPGLMAANVYLADATWVPMAVNYEGQYDEVAIEAAQLALRGGVTTVFDNWGPRDALIKARNAINQGGITAARIYVSGNWVGLGGPYSEDFRPHFREAVGEPFAARINSLWETNVGEELVRMSPDEVRHEVREYVQTGIDFLTYPVNVHRRGAYPYIVFSPRVQRVIVDEGHRAGVPVRAIFATTDEGVQLALEAGADIVAPSAWGGRSMSPETIAQIVRAQVPFLLEAPSTDELESCRQNSSPSIAGIAKCMEAMDLDVRALIRAEAPLLLGRWGGLYSADQVEAWGRTGIVPIGQGHIFGLRILQQKGMRPMDALMAATRNVARAFKLDKHLGTLEPGKFADLVVLDRNPLEDVEHYCSVHLVVKDGRIIDRDALPTRRLVSAPE